MYELLPGVMQGWLNLTRLLSIHKVLSIAKLEDTWQIRVKLVFTSAKWQESW